MSQAVTVPGNSDAQSAPSAGPSRLPYPSTVVRGKILWVYAIPFIIMHIAALLIFVPYFFSWTGVAFFLFGINFYGQLGIPICYHRQLTHKSFRTPKWVERCFVINALCCAQDTPAKWVAWHRIHHNHSDHQEDPHSPFVNFFWSHIGWLLVENRGTHDISAYHRYARDILSDPFYLFLEKHRWVWAMIYLAHALVFFWAGFGIGYAWGGIDAAWQMAWSCTIWGIVARTVYVWHITWAVNSLPHLFGYRNYTTDEGSRNNWLVAVVTGGEGWHNNHHFDQASCTVQHRWWEFDMNYYFIKVMEKLGLATNIIPPKHLRWAGRKVTTVNEGGTPLEELSEPQETSAAEVSETVEAV